MENEDKGDFIGLFQFAEGLPFQIEILLEIESVAGIESCELLWVYQILLVHGKGWDIGGKEEIAIERGIGRVRVHVNDDIIGGQRAFF